MLQLALNATQHTSTDQEIHLGTEIVDDQLHLWVRDTGSGIPPADRERVFDRFVAAAAPTVTAPAPASAWPSSAL